MYHTNSMKKVVLNNKALFIPLIIIMIISFFNMYNSKFININYTNHLTKQIIWYILGFEIVFLINKINISKILKKSFILYLISCLLLVLVLIFGQEINGSKAWFNLSFFSFQPSELVKLTLTIYLIDILTKNKTNNIKEELILILKLLFIIFIPSILVFLEPDTGAIIFYLIILISLLYSSNISKWWLITFFIILIIFGISFYLLFTYNQELLIKIIGTSFFYRIERILTFTNNNSYQLNNALIAMGSSSFLGSGIKKVSLYIPEAPTDFIFAFNISNFGIISAFIILICYLTIDYYFINLIFRVKNNKTKYFIISFFSIFFFQQIINISMNLGLLPIIGIPLPFLSYGGSTIIIYFIFIGIILNYLKKERIII